MRNPKNSLVRAAVISVDRLVSGISREELEQHLEKRSLGKWAEEVLQTDSSLRDQIQLCLNQFSERFPGSERNRLQQEATEQLFRGHSLGVLWGPAGLGKTKVALEAAKLAGAKKIFWFCPRVQVCLGIFKDLGSQEYLPETALEICTGEFKLLQK